MCFLCVSMNREVDLDVFFASRCFYHPILNVYLAMLFDSSSPVRFGALQSCFLILSGI